jgi:IS5 family transposase
MRPKQQTLASSGLERYRKRTRSEQFLANMNQVVPWGPQILAAINSHLAEQGFKVSTGTIVDATIISAPSSTKNRDGERDPQVHQTRKGNEWHSPMKAHIGSTVGTS